MSSKPNLKSKGVSASQRLQPIRATQPFQLRQGSPARKSPSSPTSMLPRSAPDPRRNKWQTDHRTSPDRAERRSPNSPSIKVTNRRSPSPRVCRTSSLDSVPALTGTYLTGQWPRELAQNSFTTPSTSGTSSKSTQTSHDWNTETSIQQSKGSKSLSSRAGGFQDVEVKQMKQQMRRIAKSSRQEKKERQSPVHANHSALPQSQAPQPRSISNPIPIFGRAPRRQNSLEGLNKEIENIIIKDTNETNIRITTQGITPPDGHRAPAPRQSSTRAMETQTHPGFLQEIGVITSIAGSHSPSPNPDHGLASNMLRAAEIGVSPCPKYASSPRPNNSYMFKREPPEGAESVKPFKEQDIQYSIGSSCPDKQKVHFHPSSFSKFQKPHAGVEQNNNSDKVLSQSHSPQQMCIVNGNKGFSSPTGSHRFDLKERSSGAGADANSGKVDSAFSIPTTVA